MFITFLYLILMEDLFFISANTVVKAYRQLALKHHPDKHPEGNSEQFLTILQGMKTQHLILQ
jgi:hypothetical protein